MEAVAETQVSDSKRLMAKGQPCLCGVGVSDPSGAVFLIGTRPFFPCRVLSNGAGKFDFGRSGGVNPKMHATQSRIPDFWEMLAPTAILLVAAGLGLPLVRGETIAWSGGGSGNWDQTNAGWSTVTADPWNTANGGSNTAEFNEAAATVTVAADGVYANGITFTQAATLSGGTITLAGATPSVSLAASSSIGSSLAGSNGLTVTGGGRLTLGSDNAATLSGPIDLSSGRVQIGADNALGSGSVDARNSSSSSAIWIGGGYRLDNDITLTGGTTFSYTNVAVLVGYTGKNSGSGATLGGTLTVNGTAYIGNDGSNPVVLDGSLAGNGTLYLTSRNGGLFTLNAASSFTGRLEQNPSFNAYSIRLGHANALQDGTLSVKHRSLSFAATAGGTFTLGALTGSLAFPLQDTAGEAITLRVGNKNSDASYSGDISGPGSLVKIGTGTFTLTGTNTYAGDTTISAGSLVLSGSGSLAASQRIIVGDAGSNGAVFDLASKTSYAINAGQTLGGTGTVLLGSSTALTVDGTLSPGNSPGLLTYAGGGTVTLAGTTLMEISGTARGVDPGYDAIDIETGTTLTLGGILELDFGQTFADGTTFDLFAPDGTSSLTGTFSSITMVGSAYADLTFTENAGLWTTNTGAASQSMTFDSSTGNLTIVAVPEPTSLAALTVAAGCGGLALLRQRPSRVPSAS